MSIFFNKGGQWLIVTPNVLNDQKQICALFLSNFGSITVKQQNYHLRKSSHDDGDTSGFFLTLCLVWHKVSDTLCLGHY